MGEEDLFEALKSGENEALRQWWKQYGPTLAKIAFQYGLTNADAKEAAAATCRELFQKLRIIDNRQQFNNQKYAILFEQVKNYQQTEVNEFIFEEDYVLHQHIIQAGPTEKSVFILAVYLQKEVTDIQEILNLSYEEVVRKKEAVLETVNGPQIDHRIRLLQKSYDRMSFQLDEGVVFEGQEIQEAVEEGRNPRPKWTIPLVALGVFFISSLIFYSFYTSEPYQAERTEKWLNKMVESYEQQRVKVLEELGLEEKNVAFSSAIILGSQYLSYEEQEIVERFIRSIERNLAEGRPINKKQKEKQLEEYIEGLKTPHQMVNDLVANPLTNDLEASEAFIEDYLPKRYIISSIYLEEIYDKSSMLTTGGEFLSIEELLQVGGLTFTEIESIIGDMAFQHLYLQEAYNDYEDDQQKYLAQLRDSLHPDVHGYVTLLELIPYTYYWVPVNEIHATPKQLDVLEKTLQTTTMNEEVSRLLQNQYEQALLMYIRGGSDELYDSNGQVHKNVQQKWQDFIVEENHPIATFVLEKVIEEFQETNWRISETQVYLDSMNLILIIDAAKRGVLEQSLWKMLEEGHTQVRLPNEGYEYLVNRTYKQIKQQKGQIDWHSNQVMTMIGVFLLASKNEDYEILTRFYDSAIGDEEIVTHVNLLEVGDIDFTAFDHFYFDSYSQTVHILGKEKSFTLELEKKDNEWFIQSLQAN